MHKLESPHILKFHDWYETRNNLWLILEYCTGADLESLLKQDGHLPEASVRMFGLDMVAALKVRLMISCKRQLLSFASLIKIALIQRND